MSSVVESLWPASIKASVLPPFTILEQQAHALTAQTKGVLVGAVTRDPDPSEPVVRLRLDVHAPALDYKYRLLVVSHNKERPYPVFLESPKLEKPRQGIPLQSLLEPDRTNVAENDDAFRGLLAKVF